mgnify:FL=1
MKQITSNNEAVSLMLAATYELSLNSAEELLRLLPFVVNQKKLGAGTLGELAIKNLPDTIASEMPICPRCGSDKTVKNGMTGSGNQRFLCKGCDKSFLNAVDSLGNAVTQDAGKWMMFVQNFLKGETIRANALMCGISEHTALDWRLRIFEALESLAEHVQLSGVIDADDTRVPYNLKGNHGPDFVMPRTSRKRGGQNTHANYHKNQICVLCAIDKQGRSFSRCVGFGKPNAKRLIEGFQGKLCVNDDTVLVSDGDRAFGVVVQKHAIPRHEVRIAEKKGSKRYPAVIDDIHLQKINAYHSRLKAFLAPAHGTASRYLPGMLLLFDYLENNKRRPLDEMAIEVLCAMTQNIGKTTVEQLKQKYSIPVSNGPEKYTWEMKIKPYEQAAYRDWMNGMPAKEVTAKYELKPHRIYQIRDKVIKYNKHDAIMSPEDMVDHSDKQPELPSNKDWTAFKRHYREKETLQTIAEDYGVTPQAIWKRIRKVRRTPEGSKLEKKWQKAQKQKRANPATLNEEIAREVNLLRGAKVSMNAACGIVAASKGLTQQAVFSRHYEHRRKNGETIKTADWMLVRGEMGDAEYREFCQSRNQTIYQDYQAMLKTKEFPRKMELYDALCIKHGLSLPQIYNILRSAKKADGVATRICRANGEQSDYLAVLAEMEKEPGLKIGEYIRRAAIIQGVRMETVSNNYYIFKRKLKQQG